MEKGKYKEDFLTKTVDCVWVWVFVGLGWMNCRWIMVWVRVEGVILGVGENGGCGFGCGCG